MPINVIICYKIGVKVDLFHMKVICMLHRGSRSLNKPTRGSTMQECTSDPSQWRSDAGWGLATAPSGAAGTFGYRAKTQ